MNKGRKNKVRYIQKMPKIAQFSPRGKAGRPDEVELRIDQYEAIKLADFQGYNQSEGAEQMGLSRASFGRILREGRKIVANALVNGKIIRIRTGNVQVGVRQKNLPNKTDMTQDEREKLLRENIMRISARKARSLLADGSEGVGADDGAGTSDNRADLRIQADQKADKS